MLVVQRQFRYYHYPIRYGLLSIPFIQINKERELKSPAEEQLRNPPPDSAIARARDFGIDLTLLIERLQLTPEERVLRLQQAMTAFDQIRGIGKKQA